MTKEEKLTVDRIYNFCVQDNFKHTIHFVREDFYKTLERFLPYSKKGGIPVGDIVNLKDMFLELENSFIFIGTEDMAGYFKEKNPDKIYWVVFAK